MITDYDEDTHFCLKCHMTVLGLDNYVSHRKSNCSKAVNVVEIPKSPLPSQLLTPDEFFTAKADDFFSSLELQSSTKKPSAASAPGGKSFSGILTRSKTSTALQAASTREEVPQSKSGKNAWIGGHQLKELGSGDNQTRLIKAVDNLSRNNYIKKDVAHMMGVYDESEEDSEEYDSEDEEYEDDEDAPPRTGGKWKPSSPVSEWHVPPHNYTGGKWKPRGRMSLTPPQNHTKGKWRPPSPILQATEPTTQQSKHSYETIPSASFTGSKWTPAKARGEFTNSSPPSLKVKLTENYPPSTHTKGKWISGAFDEEDVYPSTSRKSTESHPPSTHTKGKWASDRLEVCPPATHTKGKWKPGSTFPPPTHTKGKWKPGEADKGKPKDAKRKPGEDKSPFRKSNGSVQYWCGPCNRRLASKVVYERHLKTELHFKRTVHETEFDDSSHLNTNPDKEAKRTIRKPVEYWSHTGASANNTVRMKKAQRIRRKIYVKCEVCRSRVMLQMIGKHLISHYHCRKGDIRCKEAQKMVLDNIHSVVLQAPFQCAPCKFYSNTQSQFLRHWQSPDHIQTANKNTGYLWCSYCKFACSDNEAMLKHLASDGHQEVILVINRSVPIRIMKINPVVCTVCSKEFLLNIQLRKHCETEGHEYSGTSTDVYQTRQICQHCNRVFKSTIALQRHMAREHKLKAYFCSFCSLQFNNLDEISKHRKSREHHHVVLSKKNLNKKRTCDFCKLTFESLLYLREHLKLVHPEYAHSCAKCGAKFTISQDLVVHSRSNSCQFNQETKANVCDQCPFSSESPSELLYHRALHNEALLVESANGTGKKPQKHYKCPICEKFFPKVSLRYHIRNHLNERAFKCTYCEAKFARKSNWKLHVKAVHELKRQVPKRLKRDEKEHLCAICGINFSKRSSLKNHMVLHNGKTFKCPEPNCLSVVRNISDLKNHMKLHSNEKNYACQHCNYRGNSNHQLQRHLKIHTKEKKYKCQLCPFRTRLGFKLKRHQIIHTGAKPYACSHCEYRCNNLENLRKHVLSTNKHPGKCIYECKLCAPDAQFQANFAKEFKVHLIGEHGDMFESATEASTYIAGFHDSMQDVPDDRKEAADAAADESEDEEPQSSGSLNAVQDPTPFESKGQEELFPMYIISKDDVICVEKDAWNMLANFEVDESGTLVPFSEGEALFQEHFE